MKVKTYLIASSLLVGLALYTANETNRRHRDAMPRELSPQMYEQVKKLEVDTDLTPYVVQEKIKDYRNKLINKEAEIVDDIISKDMKELSKDRDELKKMEIELEGLVQLLK